MALPVDIEGAMNRMQALVDGIDHADILPPASAKRLVRLTKSLRKFCEAREYAVARAVLVSITGLADSAGSEMKLLPDLIEKHVKPLDSKIEKYADGSTPVLLPGTLRAIR